MGQKQKRTTILRQKILEKYWNYHVFLAASKKNIRELLFANLPTDSERLVEVGDLKITIIEHNEYEHGSLNGHVSVRWWWGKFWSLIPGPYHQRQMLSARSIEGKLLTGIYCVQILNCRWVASPQTCATWTFTGTVNRFWSVMGGWRWTTEKTPDGSER